MSDQPQFPIGTLVLWNGDTKSSTGANYSSYKKRGEPFVVMSHWRVGDRRFAAYPAAMSTGEGYWEQDLMLAEGPW